MSDPTPFHFVKTSPRTTGTVLRPNGSAKAGDLMAGPAATGDSMDGSAGSSVATFAGAWVSSCARSSVRSGI